MDSPSPLYAPKQITTPAIPMDRPAKRRPAGPLVSTTTGGARDDGTDISQLYDDYGVSKKSKRATPFAGGSARLIMNYDDGDTDADDTYPPGDENDLKEQAATDAVIAQYGTQLAAEIHKTWEINRIHKVKIEYRLLACLRSRRSEYDPTQLAQIMQQAGGDVVFVPLTDIKCRAAKAWVKDVLLQPGQKAWGLDPVRIPKLPPQIEQQIRQVAIERIMQQQASNGQPMSQEEALEMITDTRDEYMQELRRTARRRMDAMEDEIETLMEDGEYDQAISDFIDDFVTYPAAFLEGPFLLRKKQLKWGPNWQPQLVDIPTPCWRRLSPFDIYPAPQTNSVQKGKVIVRRRYRRDELSKFRGMKHYSTAAIDRVLDLHGTGGLKYWLFPETQRRMIEDQSYDFWPTDDMVDGLQFYGAVDGQKLRDWGMSPADCPDPHQFYEVSAIMIGQDVIYCAINEDPLGQRPIHNASWDEVPGAIWGNSIPEQMDDVQRVCNATARAIVSNLGIASGPQVMANTAYMPQGENITGLYPWKIWQYSDELGNVKTPIVSFFQPDSNAPELLQVMEKFEIKADDATGVPRYSYGNDQLNGAAGTASGLSMLMNSTAKGIRDAISTIDRQVISRTIRQTWMYLMLYSQDHSIKGDCQVVPRGAAALLIKEHMQTAYTQFLAMTNNPLDSQIVGIRGRAKVLRRVAEALEMNDDVVPSDEVIEKMLANQPPPQPTPDAALKANVDMAKVKSNERIKATKLALDAHKQGIPMDLGPRPMPGPGPQGPAGPPVNMPAPAGAQGLPLAA